jgi:hypothetical protein
MGFNHEHAHDPIVVDLETVSLELAADYVPPPDLSLITAAKNLKDPVKVADDLAKRQAEALAGHAAQLGKAALDFNLARIVAIGWLTAQQAHPSVVVCRDEDDEAIALTRFWTEVGHGPLLGFRIRTFDAPMLMARSRYLGVRYPALDLSRYARGGRLTDLWDVLTFGLSDYECTSVMPRKLKSYGLRFGVSVPDDIAGKDIGALVAAGQWDDVAAHCGADVTLTAALARRVGVLQDEPQHAPR